MKRKDLIFVAVICFFSAIIGGVVNRQVFGINVFAKLEKEIIPKINSEKKGEKAFAGAPDDYIDGVQVDAESPSDEEILKYGSSKWEPGFVGSGTDSAGSLASACVESGEFFGFTGSDNPPIWKTLFTTEIYILPGGITTIRGKMFFDHISYDYNLYMRFKIGATTGNETSHYGKADDVWSDEITMSFSSTGWQTLELQGKPTRVGVVCSRLELRGWVIYGE